MDQPLSYEEHRDLGREISATKSRLLHLGDMVSSVYGAESASAADFQKVNEALDQLGRRLGAQADKDCPGRRASDFYK
jgi:hypothetical protein